ncbi:MAG: hypothetical protein LBV23_04525 [Deltaproteobacteria bacterium]|nr:hypothetical protein [Deltaproteobacteria bacterium]
MWRIILIALLFYLIIWVARSLVSSERGHSSSSSEDELVRDALTGIYFDKKKALTVTRGGETLYFLSVNNRDSWLRNNGRNS